MTPKAQQALNDPKFYQLPPAEQQKALAMVDKDFGGLPLEERNKVLQMGQQKLSTGSAAAPAPSPVAAPPTPTDWRDRYTQILPHDLHSLLLGKNGQFDIGAYANELVKKPLANIGASGLGLTLGGGGH